MPIMPNEESPRAGVPAKHRNFGPHYREAVMDRGGIVLGRLELVPGENATFLYPCVYPDFIEEGWQRWKAQVRAAERQNTADVPLDRLRVVKGKSR